MMLIKDLLEGDVNITITLMVVEKPVSKFKALTITAADNENRIKISAQNFVAKKFNNTFHVSQRESLFDTCYVNHLRFSFLFFIRSVMFTTLTIFLCARRVLEIDLKSC